MLVANNYSILSFSQAFVYPANDANGTRGVWTESPSHGIDPPMCQEAEFSRDNHLGNGPSGYPNLFNWTIPEDAIAEKCAVRIRYLCYKVINAVIVVQFWVIFYHILKKSSYNIMEMFLNFKGLLILSSCTIILEHILLKAELPENTCSMKMCQNILNQIQI